MLVLDTNVISDQLRQRPDPSVSSWFAKQVPASLYTTAITLAEMLFGLELMPEGARRHGLMIGTGEIFGELFAGRVLPFDEMAAAEFAIIHAERQRTGRPISQLDCQIAAIARARGATLATRNTRDFTGCGIDVVDPWEVGRS